MVHKTARWCVNGFILLLLLISTTTHLPAAAQVEPPEKPRPNGPVMRYAEHFDASPPLTEMAARAQNNPTAEMRVRPALKLPKASIPSSTSAELLPAYPVSASMPAPLFQFEGVRNGEQSVLGLPPDTNGDIGDDPLTGKKYYMQWVNFSFKIWDVTNPLAPILMLGPVAGSTIWAGFPHCGVTNDGDPIVIFDQFAHRWNVSQFSIDKPYYQCVAVSQSADPTQGWYRYEFFMSDTKMNDYPKMAVWPDGYYMSINQFSSGIWAGAGAVVFEREKMLAGQTARMIYYDLYGVNSDFGGMLPSDADGDLPPPAGSPAIFMEWDDGSLFPPEDALRLWEFHVDWAAGTSSFGVNGQPNQVIPTLNVAVLTENIPQYGTTIKLDTLADRLMHRLQYRNYGGHQSLVTNHTVDVDTGPSSRAGVHWFELRSTGGDWEIYNEGVHAPEDGNHRWMASAALDAVGNLALGYSISSSTVYPSIVYTGRLWSDPRNTLPQGEMTLKTGTGSQLNLNPRWGDYSMMSVDSLDGCTFWYTNEYYQFNSDRYWYTTIGGFIFPNCTPAGMGTLAGSVKDLAGAPISGAKVSLTGGDVPLETYTDGSGLYAISAPARTYTVTASAYGFLPSVPTNVTINTNQTTQQSFTLLPAALVTVQGVVSDGSGHPGMPLYARIDIAGYPGGPVFTHPLSGQYNVQLYTGSTYAFTVNAVSGGYLPGLAAVTPVAGGLTQDFALSVDAESCSAPGYQLTGGLVETFDALTAPPGWTVVDHTDPPTAQVWRFDDPYLRGNLTGGSGGFAIVDSDFYGSGGSQNTSLVSPAMDFSGLETVTILFKTSYNHNFNEKADVDVSVDGGITWTNVWQRVSDLTGSVSVNISTYARHQPDVRVRFHYYDASYDWWWQVDDVAIGPPVCTPLPGGMVGGSVLDANTGLGLAGATVTSGTLSTTAFATPLDNALPEGYYLLFTPAALQTVSASMPGGYQTQTRQVTVVADSAVPLDFNLPAGQLAFNPGHLSISLAAEGSADLTTALLNSGAVPATFSLTEAIGLPAAPQVTGPFAATGRRTSPKQLFALSAEGVRVYEPPSVEEWPAAALLSSWTTGLASPWGIGLTDSGQVWVSSAALGGGDDEDHLFDLQGTLQQRSTSTADWSSDFAADMAYDLVSGHLWQVDVGGEGCIYEMDPRRARFTGVKVCPAFPHSVRGLAFDSLNRTFYAGSWIDGIIYHFDLQGTLLDSTATGLNLSGMAVNPMTGHLFVLSNAAVGRDVYVLDARRGYAFLGGFDIDGMSDFGQAGLEFSPDGRLWAVDQKSGQVFVLASGESDLFAFADVPWLTVSPLSGGVPAAGEIPVQVSVNMAGLPAGIYYAHLLVADDTPYNTLPFSITVRLDLLPTYLPVISK